MSQQQLYTNVFGPASGDEPDVKLNEIIARYPYYATAHYFLLQHVTKDSQGYAQLAGRTALHFNNPFYLNYILHNDQTHGIPVSIENGSPEGITAQQEAVVPAPEHLEEVKKKRNEEELIFEPLYTTDYFASQGIKLSEEVKPDDKLGKQLRSFTDWLKTMKKVHEQRLPSGNAALDLTVQTIAEKSNQEEEIITESMADVYKEQGKVNKAREIYQKLSLLDPSKSAYFAAKIDSLKDL